MPYSSVTWNIVNNFNDWVLEHLQLFESRPIDFEVNVSFTLLKKEVLKNGESLSFDVCSNLDGLLQGQLLLTRQRAFALNTVQLQLYDLV